MGTKHCSKCSEVKPLDEFRADKRAADGRRSECAACTRAYHAKWRERNREHVREYLREWKDEHADKVAEYARDYYSRNTEEYAARKRQDRAANPEKYKAYGRAYFERTREEHRARYHAYQARKKNAATVDLTADEWAAIVAAYNGKCAYCGETCVPEVEHVVPMVLGGSHTAANIVPACRACNKRKGGRTPEGAGMKFAIHRPRTLVPLAPLL